jgi:hypothetical protein
MKIKQNLAISETGFLFNPGNGDSFSVNPIGLEIIQLVKAGQDAAAIKSTLLEAYAVDSDTLEKDIYDFLNTLRRHKLVHEA